MPDETPILKLPYPEAEDAADVPKDVKALAEATEGAVLASNNSTYRLLLQGRTALLKDLEAGSYFLGVGGNALASGAVAARVFLVETSVAADLPIVTYFDDADYAVGGKTQKLRIRAQAAVNATKPTIKFTVGLYPVTATGGQTNLN